MILTLAVDENNDLFLGPGGALATAQDLAALVQITKQAVQTQLGEMVFAVDQGIPNFATAWSGAPNLGQFTAYLRRAILSVQGNTGITSLQVRAEAGAVRYAAVISTIYGPGAING